MGWVWDDYNETLKFINATILFFQANPFFNANSTSSFPAELGKLEYEIERISYHEMHNLWSAMGAKYQPSVIYKLRLVTLQANEAEAFGVSVTQTSTTVGES